jgi:transposase
MREAIEARGAALRYLPKYSPDLNPIEMLRMKSNGICSSSYKSRRRDAGRKAPEFASIRRAVTWASPEHADRAHLHFPTDVACGAAHPFQSTCVNCYDVLFEYCFGRNRASGRGG